LRWDNLKLDCTEADGAKPYGARAESAPVGSARAKSAKAESARAENAPVGSARAEPARGEKARAGRAPVGSAGGENARSDKARGGQARAGNARAENTGVDGTGQWTREPATARPGRPPQPATMPLFERAAVTRTFDTPGFRGITFYEIQARSIINRVPVPSRMSFNWTINPYRGCSHACVYCFARNTHTYLDLDAGLDFDSKIIVKVNAAELARKALAAPRWAGEHVAMGTNVDPYQRAEGKYRLMPGIISALVGAANPFSILTKGTLILRDLDLLREAAQVTDVGLNVSVGCIDNDLWRLAEPGTPSPRRRLDVCATLSANGLSCGVLMGPVIPFLSDSPAQLDAAVRQIAAAGASRVAPIVLHLRPGAREWFGAWLREHHPGLVPAYRRLYRNGSYAPKSYQQRISEQVRDLARRYGIGRPAAGAVRLRAASRGPAVARPASRGAAGPRDGTRAADRTDSSPGPAQLSLL
jgi:DNA repair photolyase